MRVVFMGTPDFAVPILDALADHHDVICVYSQPPRPAGRGKQDRPSPVQLRAQALGIPTRHPTSLRTPEALADFTALKADIAVVVAYGLILPQAILDAPAKGCLNIHASLLPRWRGAAPIHRAIMAGDTETGICIMQMEAGLDTGPVMLRRTIPIRGDDTTADLHDRLAALGATMIIKALETLPMPQPQSTDGVTYATKIDKSEARVDWTETAVEVDRQVRGLSPFPGAWCDVAGERLKLLRSHVAKGGGTPGQVLHGLTIACGTGAVEITLAQREGKRPMLPEDLLRGWTLPDRLS
jgi:methionyl-tRNA formyltransferase